MSGFWVADAGASLLVEDGGRPGWAHLGVPPSGALDPDALTLANRLVGNDPSLAGLEIALGGVELVAETSARIALTGADLPMWVDGRAAPWGEPVSVRRGQRVRFGAAGAGLRAWLAVGGGVDVPTVLGSRSTDTLSGLGPVPLSAGDRVRAGDAAAVELTGAAAVPGGLGNATVALLPLLLGPRADWFEEQAVAGLFEREYVVAAASDRVALRLEPADGGLLNRRDHRELPSEGVVTGAVQVPPSGTPLIFLADHPVTGGYPVVGVIGRAGVARCAQLRPGARLRLRPD